MVRQLFFVSDGVHHPCAEINPVRAVFTTEKAAKDWAIGRMRFHIDHSNEPLTIREDHPSSVVVYRIGSFDSSGLCETTYSVIKESMMV